MSKIKILTPDIYNKISAGEVIENPAGVVKELVENCIDAGANRIVIRVDGGGFDLISVSDNGCGIDFEDVENAFLKHATSKVGSMDDLYYLQTLGFRGEALASIAAVSKVMLTTRTNNEEGAICVNVENGEIISKQFVSANVGTKIEVRELFYNTPARKKFLKTPAREGSEISKFVSKFILTNPNIAIEYYLDNQLVYLNNGNGLEEAIFTVYGGETLEKCIQVNSSWQLMNITGYIGAPSFSKPNKMCQTLAVNGRYISDAKISASIMQAYKPYLMTRQYPFYILFLEIPCDRTDVNVHPKKSEIRFTQHDRVAAAFYSTVSKALTEYVENNKPLFNSPYEQNNDGQQEISFGNGILWNSDNVQAVTNGNMYDTTGELMNPAQAQDVIEINHATQKAEIDAAEDMSAYVLSQKLSVEQMRREMGLPNEDFWGRKQKSVKAEIASQPEPSIVQEVDEDERLYNRTRILGVAFKTYIILEIDDKIVLVDQHAAHERILFDQFMQRKNLDMQQLMFPYVFKVSDQEAEFIQDNLDNIKQAGFEVQPFGKNTFRIVAVSSLLIDTKMDKFVEYILASIDDFKLDSNELIVEKLAQKACKAAIKAGYVPNKYEIIYILKHVLDGSVLTCPHGRPVYTVITRTQMEKMFKRKV